MHTAELLTAYETCDRKGVWSRDYQRHRLDPNTMLQRAIRAGLTEADREDFGQVAGETLMELAAEPGMEMPVSRYLHESVIHHAALADMLTTALRKPQAKPWPVPPPPPYLTASWDAGWTTSALMDPSGTKLRSITLATSWSDQRHWATVRSWQGLGEVARYNAPMTMAVLILGPHRDGRRNGPWTKGFLHPQNHKLRFRKKSKSTSEVFSEKWQPVWREDRADITNAKWLQGMLDDDILRDVCFTVDIPVPEKPEVQRIRDMARRKLDRLAKAAELPEASMSVCDRPPCPFKACCWSKEPFTPAESNAFTSLLTMPKSMSSR